MVSSSALVQLAVLVTGIAARPMPFGHSPVAVSQDHFEVLSMRASTEVNPNAVTGTVCTDTKANIVFHDQNVAELAICGGIAGSIEKCGGSPSSTTGSSGTAKFVLRTTDKGATINVSKGRWEGCVRAARAVCPTGAFTSTCIGGASSGNIDFTLSNP